MKILIPFLLISSAFAQNKVIYGEDSRRDVFEEKNSVYVEYARATAAKVPTIYMRRVGNEMIFRTMSLADRGICSTERFSHQQTSSMCSGFLVGEKTLVTAGHCVNTINDCKNFRWVFDYKVDDAEQSKMKVPFENVFSCKRVIAQKFDKEPGEDWAIIELDRKVPDRRPLAFRRSGKISVNSNLLVIGNPSGLPTKIADVAQVRSLAPYWFVANLDTFGGNSGSAVINVDTGEVEGILVRGENDYVEDVQRKCKVANRCENNSCRGEDVNYIPELLLALPLN
jgi:V8-like Glu-specific endopeptidase